MIIKQISMPENKTKKFNLFLPEDLHQMLKIYSATSNEGMNEIIVDVLSKFIGKKKKVNFINKFEQ